MDDLSNHVGTITVFVTSPDSAVRFYTFQNCFNSSHNIFLKVCIHPEFFLELIEILRFGSRSGLSGSAGCRTLEEPFEIVKWRLPFVVVH